MGLRPWLPTILLGALGVFFLACAAWWLDGRVYLQALFFLSYALMAVPDRAVRSEGASVAESDRIAYGAIAMLFLLPVGLLGLYLALDINALGYAAVVGLHLVIVFSALEAWGKLHKGRALPDGPAPLPHA
jgi:hypothetical protein